MSTATLELPTTEAPASPAPYVCPIIPSDGLAVCKPEPWRNAKVGGVYLPDVTSERFRQNVCVVLAMGKQLQDNVQQGIAPPAEVGDLVVVAKFMEVWPEGPHKDSLYMVDHSHIVGKLTRKARTDEDVIAEEKVVKTRLEQEADAQNRRNELGRSTKVAKLISASGH